MIFYFTSIGMILGALLTVAAHSIYAAKPCLRNKKLCEDYFKETTTTEIKEVGHSRIQIHLDNGVVFAKDYYGFCYMSFTGRTIYTCGPNESLLSDLNCPSIADGNTVYYGIKIIKTVVLTTNPTYTKKYSVVKKGEQLISCEEIV